jgi:hypothetical protein
MVTYLRLSLGLSAERHQLRHLSRFCSHQEEHDNLVRSQKDIAGFDVGHGRPLRTVHGLMISHYFSGKKDDPNQGRQGSQGMGTQGISKLKTEARKERCCDIGRSNGMRRPTCLVRSEKISKHHQQRRKTILPVPSSRQFLSQTDPRQFRKPQPRA